MTARVMPVFAPRLFALMAMLAGATVSALPVQAAPQAVSFDSQREPGSIVIRTAERKLYLMTGQGAALVYDIAVGKPRDQWFGESWVSKKRPAPTWRPTPSMRRANPRLPHAVAPGPNNPLGERAINLGWGTYRVHGTNNPGSIGSAASAGCFRMKNADVKDFYDRVHVGAAVFVER